MMSDRARLIRTLGASLLLIGGSFILFTLVLGLTSDPSAGLKYEKVGELLPGFPGFPDAEMHFPIQKIDQVGIAYPDGHHHVFDVAHYQDIAGQIRQALIFLSTKQNPQQVPAQVADLNHLTWQAWLDASASFRNTKAKNALFMTWWDNAQRIHLLSGKKSWANAPAREAFDRRQQGFWQHVSGGFLKHSEPLKQLADWLLMDAQQAIDTIEQRFEKPNQLYFLVTIDDLARLSEMSTLSGKSVPFETRVFRSDENIHRLISRMRRWAREKGNGSYLVQHLPQLGVRVWRITTAEGEKTLLARLLPFTSSLANPLRSLKLVHRSEWSGYISIYGWRFI